MARVILHIGTYKTGSTAIQSFMRKNEAAFAQQSIYYPTFKGDSQNHTFLRTSLMQEDAANVADCRDVLQRCVDADPNATIVLSSEHYWPLHGPKLQEMLDVIEKVCPDITTVIYLRRQDKLWASLYAQMAKSMSIRPEHALWGQKGFVGADIAEHGMYYFECLEEYANRFGREKVVARLYERRMFPNGDAVEDFVQFIGGKMPADPIGGDDDTNLSFAWKAVEFSKYCAVQYAARFGRKKKWIGPVSGAMRDTVARLQREEGFTDWIGKAPLYLPPDEQLKIVEHYRPSNEKLFEHYFGGQDVFGSGDTQKPCPYGLADIPEVELRRGFELMTWWLARKVGNLGG
ncbi:hypothetical protein L2U69_16615 [Zavarzinia compransoris]|uniref:hypothetical protein n=1 Tax=Zavarzinia marina TaxID=2911065 RepID=UPI001F18AED5|nr:hypothetical protein [Zavarzinia marina]MCF4167273.1 hypothetical protein [Zavarzinia marina]